MSNEHLIPLEGKLTSRDRSQFNSAFDFVKDCAANSILVLNFEKVDHIDSSVLGALLVLREKSDDKGVKLVIQRPKGDVSKIFKLSNFDALFEIEE